MPNVRVIYGLCLAALAANAASVAPSPPKLPFTFVENRGQTVSSVRAIGSGPAYTAWFEDEGVYFRRGSVTAHVEFALSGQRPQITMVGPTGAIANFFRGAPGNWKTGIPIYSGVRYEGLWPGIEVQYRTDDGKAKAEYRLAAGADIAEIRLHYDGTPTVMPDGSLVVRTATGEIREDPPAMYQETASGRVEVTGGFAVAGNQVGFHAEYDPSLPLVIDPRILLSGYFGGTGQDSITAVAVNSSYNVIIAGWTTSVDLNAAGGAISSNSGGADAFVAGFSPVGAQFLFCTYLGGRADDRAFGVAVDAANNTYVTGQTSSPDFPVRAAIQQSLAGRRNAFIVKLNPLGNSIIYSTFLGGAGADAANAIAVDASGQAVIAGDTTSTNFPTTSGAFQRTIGGGQDAFLARLNASGSALSFATYYGGSGTDHAGALAVDPAGQIVIGGGTYSTNLPVLAAYQAHSGGGQDGFVARFNTTGTSLLSATYLGGSGGQPGYPEQVNAIYINSASKIVAAGITSSSNFPIVGAAVQATFGGGQTDGFLAKFNAGTLVASTYLGGSLNDGVNALTGDPTGRVYAAGFTSSLDFPTTRPIQAASGGAAGSMDAFVTTLNIGLTSIYFSTYLGGSGADSANAIAVDPMTSLVVAGQTASTDYPIVGVPGGGPSEVLSSFITKIVPDWVLTVVSAPAITADLWRTGGAGGTAVSQSYGQANDVPVAGDWTGTGVKQSGIFRNGIWILDTTGDGILNAGDKIVAFGQAGDLPVVGDWNGTGSVKLGLYRNGSFILDLSGHLTGVPTGLSDVTFTFGLSSDVPVVGDWNGSGTTKVGVFRNGTWLIDYSGTQVATKTYTYGQAGDVPVTGPWDSTGITRIGVYRTGVWYLNIAGNNVMGTLGANDLYIPFGSAGMKPVVR